MTGPCTVMTVGTGVPRAEQRARQGVVVHHVGVEMVEDLGDPGGVHHLGERLPEPLAGRIVPERYEPVRIGQVLPGADESDLVTAGGEIVDEIRHDRLHAAVRRRRNVKPGWSHHRDV